MKNIIFLVFFWMSASVQADVTVVVVDADFWASPRHAESVVRYEPLAQIMRHLVAEPEARLQVSVPEGEWGELWGQELQAWLVSLGLSSSRIEFAHRDVDGADEFVTVSLSVPQPLVLENQLLELDAVPQERGPSAAVAEAVVEERSEKGVSSSIAVQDEIVVQEQE